MVRCKQLVDFVPVNFDDVKPRFDQLLMEVEEQTRFSGFFQYDINTGETNGYIIDCDEDCIIDGDFAIDFDTYIQAGGCLHVRGDMLIQGNLNCSSAGNTKHLMVDGDLWVNGNINALYNFNIGIQGNLFVCHSAIFSINSGIYVGKSAKINNDLIIIDESDARIMENLEIGRHCVCPSLKDNTFLSVAGNIYGVCREF